MAKNNFFTPHPRFQERGEITNPHTGEVTTPPSMTKQEFQRECDINNVIKQYSTTGMLNHVNAQAAAGMFTDLPDAYDFQESLHTIQAAEKAFMALPSKTRERFNNEPAEFLAFMEDASNGDEMISLGLREPPPRIPDPEPNGGGDGGTPPPPSWAHKAPYLGASHCPKLRLPVPPGSLFLFSGPAWTAQNGTSSRGAQISLN